MPTKALHDWQCVVDGGHYVISEAAICEPCQERLPLDLPTHRVTPNRNIRTLVGQCFEIVGNTVFRHEDYSDGTSSTVQMTLEYFHDVLCRDALLGGSPLH